MAGNRKKNSFANKVRKILADAGGAPVTNTEIAVKLDLVFRDEKRKIYHALRDMRQAGEVERIKTGLYRYLGQTKTAGEDPQIRKRMWRVVRSLRKVTYEDLMELTGAGKLYAKEYLRLLKKRGIVREVDKGNAPHLFVLIKDPVQMPEDEQKAAKLRRIRESQKKALDALDAARSAIDETNHLLEGMTQ